MIRDVHIFLMKRTCKKERKRKEEKERNKERERKKKEDGNDLDKNKVRK